MKKITTIQLQAVKVLTPNGFSHGLVTKRPVTTRETRYIMRNIFGIDVNDRECFESREEYNEYNRELTTTVNDWLDGNADDQAVMEYAYDCSDEPLGIFNAFKLAEYLQRKGII